MSEAVRILVVAGSLRKGAFSKKLARHGAGILLERGVQVDLLELQDVPMPPYDGDLEDAGGLPPGAIEFKRRLGAAAGFLIASPEYNFSIPGTFKNAIDWASRGEGDVFSDKVAALMGASPGGAGGMRMLPHLRQVLTALGVWLLPDQVTVSRVDTVFDENDALISSLYVKQVAALCDRLITEVKRRRCS